MCPVCLEPMVVFEFEGVEIDQCLTCSGLWLDAGELELLAERAGVRGGPIAEALSRSPGTLHDKRRCCRCRDKLRLVTVGDVEIDRCIHGHGLWFDKGELRKAIASFHDGEAGAVARFLDQLFRPDSTAEEYGG